MLYFIYACEGKYDGLHGIYDYDLIECKDINEAYSIGHEMSYNLIESYIQPEDEYYSQEDFLNEQGYEKWSREYEQEYYELLDDVIEDYISYEVYKLRPDTTYEDYETWQHENGESRNFIRDYCEHEFYF